MRFSKAVAVGQQAPAQNEAGYMRFSKALALGQQEQAPNEAPPSFGDVAREQRDSKPDEKPAVVIKQDATGKAVVVTKQP